MKKIIPFIIMLAAYSVIPSCWDNQPPYLEILFPADSAVFQLDDSIRIELSADDVDGIIEYVKIEYNNEQVAHFDKPPYIYRFHAEDYGEGHHRFYTRTIDDDDETDYKELVIIIEDSFPDVYTFPATEVTSSSVLLHSCIDCYTTSGVSEEYGFYISYVPGAQENGYFAEPDPYGSDIYPSLRLRDLNPETTVYYCAWARNTYGERFGQELSVTTLGDLNHPYGTLTDERTGQTYKTIEIEGSTWMAENLAWLPEVYERADYSASEKRYYVNGYNGIDSAEAVLTQAYQDYGVLYNKAALTDACPDGWHVSTEEEWQAMELLVGVAESELEQEGYSTRGVDAGFKLRAEEGWSGTDNNGSNLVGFSALPGGVYSDDSFWGAGYTAVFIASPASGSSTYFNRTLPNSDPGIQRFEVTSNSNAWAVRCVKDI